MSIPLQKPPVNRKDIIAPHTVVDLDHGGELGQILVRINLLHGANYNDPQPFRVMSYANAKRTL